MLLRALLVLALILTATAALRAHPHVWVDAASEVMFDAKGRIVAIRHHWLFDEAFSAFALQGLDTDRDGFYSREELEPLAKENVESLSGFGFFTFLSVGDYRAGYGAPTDYYLELSGDGRLLLHFTLPLAQPFFSRSTMLLEVFDPEYYVAFSLPSDEAVRLVDAPAACALTVYPAQELSDEAAAALAEIGPEQRELPEELKALAVGVENSAEMNCAGAATAETARQAATELAQAGGDSGDLTALPAEPAAVSAADDAAAAAAAQPAAKPRAAPSASGGLMARIAAWQAAFSRDLTNALKALKDGGAFWWLGGVSFLYGIVHAAGPGHGKVVISSYLVANEARVRRGVAIAFIAAFAQAVVAVAIIAVLAVAANRTSMVITGTADAFEMGSFALVAALGLYLMARKSRAVWALVSNGQAHHHGHHRHHGHHHHGGAACDHSGLAGGSKPGLSGAAAAVLSVGIRPCSGALVVLVFALAQGVFWAGIASTFLMALGTAITVAALAALAVGAKDLARRLTRGDGATSAKIMLGLEFLAALFITALGVVLFLGALSA